MPRELSHRSGKISASSANFWKRNRWCQGKHRENTPPRRWPRLSRAYRWPDGQSGSTISFHLRWILRHQRVQRHEHGAVVYGVSYVHRFALLSGTMCLFLHWSKENAMIRRTFLCLERLKYLYVLLLKQNVVKNFYYWYLIYVVESSIIISEIIRFNSFS